MEKYVFSIDEAKLVELSNSQFAELIMYVVSDGDNAHGLPITKEALVRAIPTLFEKPILAKYSPYTRDATTHVDDQAAIGFFPKKEDVWIEEKDGKNWLVAKGKIWKLYAKDMMKVLQKRKEAAVSMESFLEITEKDGKKIVENFVFAGVTILGKAIKPASSGANLQMLTFAAMQEELEKEDFAHRYSVIDFSIPEEVKNTAQDGLELMQKHGFGGTSQNVNMAKYLIRESEIDVDRTKKAYSIFNKRFASIEENSEVTETFVNFCLWGGFAAKQWIGGLVNQMNELDNQSVVSFEEGNSVVEPVTEPVTEPTEPTVVADSAEPTEPTEPTPTDFAANLTSMQKRELFTLKLKELLYKEDEDNEYPHFYCYIRDFDDKYLYVEERGGSTYRYAYEFVSEKECVIDIESKEAVIGGGFVAIREEKAIASEMLSELGFSSDDYIDPAAKVWFLKREAEKYREIVERSREILGFGKESLDGVNWEEISDDDGAKLFATFEKMSGMMSIYFDVDEDDDDEDDAMIYFAMRKFAKVAMACHNFQQKRILELEQFKKDVDERSKFAMVEELLDEASTHLNDEQLTEYREFAKTMDFTQFDAFANEVKAKAWEESKKHTGNKAKPTPTRLSFQTPSTVTETQELDTKQRWLKSINSVGSK